jgi:hypothetical protein
MPVLTTSGFLANNHVEKTWLQQPTTQKPKKQPKTKTQLKKNNRRKALGAFLSNYNNQRKKKLRNEIYATSSKVSLLNLQNSFQT